MRRTLLRYSILAALLLVQGGSLLASSSPLPTAGMRSEGVQQGPDPKKREVTASVGRSAENEMLILYTFFPEDASNVRVALYNILGKLIELNPVTSVIQGDQIFRFQTKGLPSGPYIIVLEWNGQRIVNKVMVSR